MAATNTPQYRVNSRVYHRAGVESRYQARILTVGEAFALLKYQPAFAAKDVLDIGVGPGRTTLYLAPLARGYQPIDYSPVMVREFQRRFPGIPIVTMDMRDMHDFADASFDFVFGSNNVFDAVSHEGRLRSLHEIHRVLRPGGVLLFSAHNRGYTDARHAPRLGFSGNPVAQLKFAAHWCIAMRNHAHLKRLESSTDDYAIINDEAHDFGLLQYYIAPDAQRRQLANAGYEVMDVLDRWGALVLPGESAVQSQWVFYVAKRFAVS